MKVEGGCHCGKITFTAEVDPDKVYLCHCTDCQQMTGAPYRVVVQAPKEGFRLSGEVKNYIKTAESGNKRLQGFCPDCGTSIYSTSITDQKLYALRVGTLKQRAQLNPRKQQWCRSALDWARDISALPGVAKQF